ncbi:uncharacterized protein Hap1MRO34_017154 [Clarias gariepinus]
MVWNQGSKPISSLNIIMMFKQAFDHAPEKQESLETTTFNKAGKTKSGKICTLATAIRWNASVAFRQALSSSQAALFSYTFSSKIPSGSRWLHLPLPKSSQFASDSSSDRPSCHLEIVIAEIEAHSPPRRPPVRPYYRSTAVPPPGDITAASPPSSPTVSLNPTSPVRYPLSSEDDDTTEDQ